MMQETAIARWERWTLIGGLALYVAAGVIYSVITPVFEAPDESFHFFVIQHIVEHRALPVQSGETQGAWEQEGSQPPLYYLIGAALVSGIDLGDAEELLWLNPQANIGDPLNPGNKNVYIHPASQGFPWRGATCAVHVLRLYSLALGAASVGLVWRIGKLLYPRRGVLPLAIAGTAAFVPQFLFISSSVNNDNLMTFFSVLVVYLLLRRLRDGPGTAAYWLGVGVVLGLALLAKLSGWALLGLAGLVIGLLAWQRRSWRLAVRSALAVGVGALAVAGWWYVRNLLLYGEPTGLTAMWEVVGRREGFGTALWGEFRGLRYSFWGLYGWFSITMPEGVYRLLDGLTVLAAAGLVLEVGRWFYSGLWRGVWNACRRREPGWGVAFRPLASVLLGVLAIVIVSALARWTSLTSGSQGRLLFPAMVSMAFFWVVGLRSWFPSRAQDVASVILTVALIALAIATPWLWIAPHYVRPTEVTQLPEDAVPLELAFGESIVLRGVRFPQAVAFPGEPFRVDLYWQTDRALPDSNEVMVWLRLIEERPSESDTSGGVIGLEDAYPGSGSLPTSLWPQDVLLAGYQYVWDGEAAPVPLVARLDVGLYDAVTGRLLAHSQGDLPTIGRVKIAPRRWPRVGDKTRLAHFDHGVSLAGYHRDDQVRPGEELRVGLTWTVESAPQRDYHVFVHLVDSQGQVWATGDDAPRRGAYPTSWWEEGEVILDEYSIELGADVPPGRYRVQVGWYDAGGRVPAVGADGSRLPGEAVGLGTAEVR